MGNRFEKLQVAIDKIFLEIGNVLKISPVYETPAFGFEGDAFLNCALLVRTELDPSEVLNLILKIEKTMGRTRQDTEGYASRLIDIDIIFIDSLIIDLDDLQVPHPEMQNRQFVLRPLLDLDPSFKHPKLKKNISQLLEACQDKSNLTKLAKWLINPSSRYNWSKYNYIAIEGNIGAGKTSLVTKIANDFNGKPILERFKDNPFLPKFYKEPARYSFALEMSFLADRYQQLLDDISQLDLFTESVVSDYDINKSLIFAKINLSEEEYALYKKLFDVMQKDLPKPDLYIYLHQNTENLLENIKKRGRNYEQSIQAEYLQKLNSGYLEFVKNQHSEKIKIIDISEFDFIKNRSDYLRVLEEIFR